jgi:hypothetical protein
VRARHLRKHNSANASQRFEQQPAHRAHYSNFAGTSS